MQLFAHLFHLTGMILSVISIFGSLFGAVGVILLGLSAMMFFFRHLGGDEDYRECIREAAVERAPIAKTTAKTHSISAKLKIQLFNHLFHLGLIHRANSTELLAVISSINFSEVRRIS